VSASIQNMEKPRVVVARPMPQPVAERLAAEFTAFFPEVSGVGAEGLAALAEQHKADAIVVTSEVKFGAQDIARLPSHVRMIATCSVGFDHFDVAAAKARNVVLTNTPDVVTDCTADLTLLLILGACRRATEYGAVMREGWRKSFAWNEMLGLQVSGKTLGIVGMGRIGRAVAKRARGFGMKVIYTSRSRLAPELENGATYFKSLHEMLPHAQVLSLHLPVTPQSERMMNAETFALLPKNAVFVNASRGRLVDEEALLDALQSGTIYAAGLDVFDNEPAYDLRFSTLPNVFMTPHIGTSTVETRSAMGFRALDNVVAVCAQGVAIDPLW
jgi:lactate dehydrogenase-like 2-hydroxyacid dehydrogenase